MRVLVGADKSQSLSPALALNTQSCQTGTRGREGITVGWTLGHWFLSLYITRPSLLLCWSELCYSVLAKELSLS